MKRRRLFCLENKTDKKKEKQNEKKKEHKQTQHHKYPKPKQPTQKLRKSQTRGRQHFGSSLCQPLLKKMCATISTANIKPELISTPILFFFWWGEGNLVQILVLAIGVLLYGSFLHLTTRNSIQKHPDHTVNGLKKYPKNKKKPQWTPGLREDREEHMGQEKKPKYSQISQCHKDWGHASLLRQRAASEGAMYRMVQSLRHLLSSCFAKIPNPGYKKHSHSPKTAPAAWL